EVRVTWARAGQLRPTARGHCLGYLRVLHVHRVGGHDGGPLRPLGVANHDGNGAAEGLTVSDARDEGQLIGLKLHPGATAIAEATAGELSRDVLASHAQPGGEIFHQRNQRLAMGFTSSSPSKHTDESTM